MFQKARPEMRKTKSNERDKGGRNQYQSEHERGRESLLCQKAGCEHPRPDGQKINAADLKPGSQAECGEGNREPEPQSRRWLTLRGGWRPGPNPPEKEGRPD